MNIAPVRPKARRLQHGDGPGNIVMRAFHRCPAGQRQNNRTPPQRGQGLRQSRKINFARRVRANLDRLNPLQPCGLGDRIMRVRTVQQHRIG